MAYEDTATIAKRLRAAYKELGWNAKQISVRISRYSMGSSITVTVKDAAVNLVQAEALAEGAEDIRRDGSGEILSGGNRFVHFNIEPEVRDELAAPYLDVVQQALNELKNTSPGGLVEINGTDILLGHGQGHRMAQLWVDGRAGMNVDECYPGSIAYHVALVAAKTEAPKLEDIEVIETPAPDFPALDGVAQGSVREMELVLRAIAEGKPGAAEAAAQLVRETGGQSPTDEAIWQNVQRVLHRSS